MRYLARASAAPTKDSFGVTVSKGQQRFFTSAEQATDWVVEQRKEGRPARAFELVEVELVVPDPVG